MSPRSNKLIIALAATLFLIPARAELAAQGVSGASIRGRVVAFDSSNADGARVRVVNTTTGFAREAEVRYGRFLVEGLEVGGPYVVTVTRLGFRPEQREQIVLRLGEPLELRVVMQSLVTALATLTVSAGAFPLFNAHGGTATTIVDSLVHRLPTLDRNVYDFVRLAPQISTKVGSQRSGVSAAGANFRFNNFLIDGAEERFVNANVSAAFNVGKSIPVDAVKEYQVLIAPYDVRYGNFAGALINTVTASGTNEMRGSLFTSWRNDQLARAGDLAPAAPYDRLQFGFSLGGPIVRDRVHFFVAPEFQRFTSPAAGPFLGQSSTATAPLPVSESDIARAQAIMRGYDLQSGSAGPVEISNPLSNLFARVDAAIPNLRSRVSASVTYAAGDDQRFTRIAPDTFSLSSYRFNTATGMRMTALRMQTDLSQSGAAYNELVLSQSSEWSNFEPDVRQPLVRIFVPGTSGNVVTLKAGSAEQAQGRFGRASSLRIRDDLSLPLGAHHVARFGVQAEALRTERGGVTGGYGLWTFASLDAFESGVPARYVLRKSLDSPSTTLRGGQYAAWVSDEWRIGDHASITAGVRADVLDISGRAPHNATIDSIFGRRTDQMPRELIHMSPRIGFSWDVGGAARNQLRGGIGLFTGRPPLAWIVPALTSYGVGVGVLSCGPRPDDNGTPPPFVPDYRAAPTACATGPGLAINPEGEVDLLDRNLRMAQSLRASLAYDRELPWGLLMTTELLLGRHLSDFIFVNMNLDGPQAVDRFGRVLYGDIGASADADPELRSEFQEVIDLRNTSRNYSYLLSLRVEKRFAQNIAATASYTYSRVRDVQSPSRVNLSGLALWGDARAISGRHEDLVRGISLNDLPHRAVAAITWRAPWRRASTDFSISYVGESGTPFTYVAGGISGRGDLNADGSNVNDPIYVPRDPFDTTEVRFSGTSTTAGDDNTALAQAGRILAQQEAFGNFIERSACLGDQRGRIMERNSCREPWTHTLIASVRQALPIGGHGVEAALDVFNVLNLLNNSWGRTRVAIPVLLAHVGQTTGTAGTTQPVFRFGTTLPQQPASIFATTRPQWTTLTTESAFQLQLSLRYRF